MVIPVIELDFAPRLLAMYVLGRGIFLVIVKSSPGPVTVLETVTGDIVITLRPFVVVTPVPTQTEVVKQVTITTWKLGE